MQATADRPNSVYRYYDHAGRLVYVGITARGIVRQHEHNGTSEWWQYVATQQVEHCPDRETALRVERALIEAHRPPFNRQHNGQWEDLRDAYLRLLSAERAFAALSAGDPLPMGDDGTLAYVLAALVADPDGGRAHAHARQLVDAAAGLASKADSAAMPDLAEMIRRLAIPTPSHMHGARSAWARKGA